MEQIYRFIDTISKKSIVYSKLTFSEFTELYYNSSSKNILVEYDNLNIEFNIQLSCIRKMILDGNGNIPYIEGTNKYNTKEEENLIYLSRNEVIVGTYPKI